MKSQIDISEKPIGLGYKHISQLIKLSDEFQPIIKFKESAFIKVVEIAELFCTYNMYPLLKEPEIRFNEVFIKNWEGIRGKYYPYGMKKKRGEMGEAVNDVIKASTKIKTQAHIVAYMRIVRACRDFLRGGGIDTATLYNKLLSIRAMYKPI